MKRNTVLFCVALLFTGWVAWTLFEYIAHRFWLHGPKSRDIFNHVHHHTHPTDIKLTNRQLVLLVISYAAIQYDAVRLQNYFTLFSGFYLSFVIYFFVYTFLHKNWFGKIRPRLQQFHFLHHCKLSDHCFGVSVHWWDYIFNTASPKKLSPTDRITQFYFTGKKQLLTLLCLALLASSCTHYYYAHNTANVPLLREKNEGRLNFNYYATDEASGGEFQGAYAIGKHTAVLLNVLSASENGQFLSGETYMQRGQPTGYGTYAEAGIGYFSQMPKTKWVFETYGGLGTGSITNWYSGSEKSKVGITKLFLQPSIGWRSREFEVAFFSRFAHARLRIKANDVPYDQDLAYIKAFPTALLIEPGVLIRFGLKWMKVAINYTHSGNVNRAWKQETTAVSIGLSIPFFIESNEK